MTRRRAALGTLRYLKWVLLALAGYDPHRVHFTSLGAYYRKALVCDMRPESEP